MGKPDTTVFPSMRLIDFCRVQVSKKNLYHMYCDVLKKKLNLYRLICGTKYAYQTPLKIKFILPSLILVSYYLLITYTNRSIQFENNVEK